MWAPSELAVSSNSSLGHWELAFKLTVGSFWGLSVTSQWTHKMTHTVSLLWAICEITRWAHHAVVAVSSLWELQTHGKLTASSQCELILWVHCELTEYPQSEPTLTYSMWALCEYGVIPPSLEQQVIFDQEEISTSCGWFCKYNGLILYDSDAGWYITVYLHKIV